MESIFFIGMVGTFEIYQLVSGSGCYTRIYDGKIDRMDFYSSVCESFIESLLGSRGSLDLMVMNGRMISEDLTVRVISPIENSLLCQFTDFFCRHLIGQTVSNSVDYEN